MVTTHLKSGAQDLTTAQWQQLYGADLGHDYARFRDHIETGPPVLLTADDGSGICAALHGSFTNPATRLFSHPWKLLTAEQLRRPEEDRAEWAAEEHARLLRAVAGGTDPAVPDATALTAALGEAMVFRSFDSTEAGLRQDLDGPARGHALRALLAHAQQAVHDGAAGAVCLPFVRTDDDDLRTALAGCGFCSAVLSASTEFDLRGVSSYEEYLTALNRKRRYVYRQEERTVVDSALRLDTWQLAGHEEQIADLEARNIAKHGGRPDVKALATARTAMADLLGDRIRVPVALDGTDALAACGIHLLGPTSYCVLAYGADASAADGVPVYQCLTFYEPVRHAVRNGLHAVRLGFEAYNAKLRRGARVVPRETWLWIPDADRLAALHRLMQFLAARTATHLERLSSRRH